MNNLTSSAIMERAKGDGVSEMKPHHPSKLLIEQALLKIKERLGRDGAEVNTPVNFISNGIQSDIEGTLSKIRRCLDDKRVEVKSDVVDMKEVTLKQVELEDRASDLREIGEYFTALDKERRNLEQLLQENREEHCAPCCLFIDTLWVYKCIFVT